MYVANVIDEIVKLPAHRAGASRRGSYVRIVPFNPAYKAGLAGHVPANPQGLIGSRLPRPLGSQ